MSNSDTKPKTEPKEHTVSGKRAKRGGDRIAVRLGPGEYTRTQVADRVGMPIETLRRWVKDGLYTPHESGRDVKQGKVQFHVYTESDVTNLRALCKVRGVKHRKRPLPAA
jgi:MerR HTH family regulatory protein